MKVGNLYSIEQLKTNGLRAVDLFCGAGVGAYGIKKAGYDIVFGVDNDKEAVKTYNANIGDHAICEDIRNINKSNIPEHDLMIATPVCKPFSICGARRLTNDEKYGDLLAETIRVFEECRPKALFFENVGGLVIGDSLPTFLDFVKQLESYGYHSYWDLINCWDLGVPQERTRVFLVLISDDVKYEFIPPKKLLFGKKYQRDAIYDLKDKLDQVPNHLTKDIPDKIWETFDVNVRQTGWDEPSKTVLSHHDAILFYPEPTYVKGKVIPRKMTVREHLRLQTVGDDFIFPEDISVRKQYERCSGVPSLVAYKYGCAIADCLLGKTKERTENVKIKSLF